MKIFCGVLSLLLASVACLLVIGAFAFHVEGNHNLFMVLALSSALTVSSIVSGGWGIWKRSGLWLSIGGIATSFGLTLFIGWVIFWFTAPGGGPFGP
jgi:hypothetical protein